MRLKKTAVVVISLFIILMASNLYATGTRDAGLGLGDHTWMIDGLQTYVFENPSYLNRYSNIVYFERTGVNHGENMGGITWNPIGKLHMGVFSGIAVDKTLWNSNDSEGFFHVGDMPSATAYQATLLDANLPTNANKIDLVDPDGNASALGNAPDIRDQLTQQDVSVIAAYTFETWGLGFSLGYASSWNDDKYSESAPTEQMDKYEFSSVQYDIGMGGYVVINRDMDVDFNLKLSLYSLGNNYKAITPGDTKTLNYESDGAMDIVAAGRFNWTYSRVHRFHFRAGMGLLNHSTAGIIGRVNTNPALNEDTTVGYDRSISWFSFGLSDEMRLSQNIKAFIGGNVVYKTLAYAYTVDSSVSLLNGSKYSKDLSYIMVPLVMGLEAQMSENWTGRFGLSHVMYDPTTNEELSTTGTGSSSDSMNLNEAAETSLHLGLSYKLGDFRIDWLANVDLFVRGPDFITGNSTDRSVNGQDDISTPIATALAVTYNFDSLLREATPSLSPK